MDLNNRRSLARSRARARFQAKWVEGTATAGAVAVAIESGYWWNLIPSGGRQSNEDCMRKISLKTRTLEANSQYLINYFDPYVANDGQNAHGPAGEQ
ncbi:hypothetical protein R3W88_010959 [Solanum pinnatisectum]|uniref:Uncharacterized protein n=1 Tax=Solanum pinnatisectum TaxID=50273 RepID=A0AAV9L4Z8_9SOLN|nr:hypothetical protein R3W88_010959 [Solanum pinnatisectum]